MRFVVGGVDNGCVCSLEPISKGQCRMIQVAGCDREVRDFKGSFYELVVSDFCTKFVQLHGKVRILHLSFEGVAQRAAHSFWGIKVPCVARREERSEERYALDVVPVRMANQDMTAERRRFGRKQVLAKL